MASSRNGETAPPSGSRLRCWKQRAFTRGGRSDRDRAVATKTLRHRYGRVLSNHHEDQGYPFEVELAGSPPSVVLADQVKSQDWRARKAARKGRVSPAELAEVRGKLLALIS